MTLKGELYRTSHLLVNIAEEQGVYFAVAFLYDGGYDTARIKALLPILEKEQGAIKMTELFEVESMISDLQDVITEIAYEANTRPGNGLVFEAKLLEAKNLVNEAVNKLTEAAEIIKKETKETTQ